MTCQKLLCRIEKITDHGDRIYNRAVALNLLKKDIAPEMIKVDAWE
jgi:hypothetical protein